jgi:hypothetical protein
MAEQDWMLKMTSDEMKYMSGGDMSMELMLSRLSILWSRDSIPIGLTINDKNPRK